MFDHVWLDGRIVARVEARIPVTDHGFTVGDAVFETIAVEAGRPLAARRHLARLARSADALRMPQPDVAALRAALDELVEVNGVSDAVFRIVHTSGSGPLGSARGEGVGTTAVLGGPHPRWPATSSVAVVGWPRNERGALAGVKSTSYAENVLALAEAQSRGASEAVFPNLAGELCEGSGSNVFVVVDGRALTPPLAAGCLAGVTRGLVLELEGIPVGEERIPMSALRDADEVFLTSATRHVQPVGEIDGRRLDAPGPVTALIAAAYAARLATDPDPR